MVAFSGVAGCKIPMLRQKGAKAAPPEFTLEIQGEHPYQFQFFKLIKNKPSDTWNYVVILIFFILILF